jgi:hypothetical protein
MLGNHLSAEFFSRCMPRYSVTIKKWTRTHAQNTFGCAVGFGGFFSSALALWQAGLSLSA